MFEKILLPLDGSELSELTIPYVEELAGKLGSEVVLYHVHGHEHTNQEHMHLMYLERVSDIMQRNIQNSQSVRTDVKITTIVEAGEPTENICNLVETNKIDLIIMTAVSTSGLKIGKMLGSVTDHVCQTVSIPVMLIRPQNLIPTDRKFHLINHILIPLDGSDLSKLALPAGEELASKLRVAVTLFQMATMIRLYSDASGSSAYIDYTKVNDDEKKRAVSEMSLLEQELKAKGLNVTNIVTSGSDAANEIIELCKRTGIDLVVMSTHGRSGLGRWVFGNVAEKILRHGETPLLLIHARAG
ncbi:MAG: universal stress protein [Dehalococcoidales bacterium]